tara:strand:+ start:933 stop:1205 length:273 start_codon:yes stop_codon:yes gene_type:complete
MSNKLNLRSGRHIVAEGDVDEILKVISALKEVRNDDANWIDIETPWRVIEEVLAASALSRDCAPKDHNGIDPFARLSVFDGSKKLISVWK